MTVSVQTPINQYTANGVTTVFAFQFIVLDSSDLSVFIDDVEVVSGFTVSGVGVDSGGSVTFDTAPESLAIVTLLRSMDPVRESDYQNSGDFRAVTVNADFDRLWLYAQQLKSILDKRALLFPETVIRSASDNVLPAPENGKILYWSGEKLENAQISDVSANVSFSNVLKQFDSMSAFLAEPAITDSQIHVRSFYPGWSGTVNGPKGESYWHHDGTTGGTPTTNTTSAIQAAMATGKVITADGKGWIIDWETSTKSPKVIGAVGGGTTDDLVPLQYYRDMLYSIGVFEIQLDADTYGLSGPLDLGISGKPFAVVGVSDNGRPKSGITAIASFTGYSMLRNWSDAMYSGAESRDGPPADMTAYASSISRYIQVKNVTLSINATQTKKITPIDLVAAHETCQIHNVCFDGGTAAKGQPLRLKGATGSQVSANGVKISNVVVYGSNWDREWYISIAGSDIDIDTWVTASGSHGLSPFYTDCIDVTVRNLHSEAFCTGQPTFNSYGTDISLHQSLVFVQDLQGDVFKNSNSSGSSGYGRSGTSLKDVRIYPVGGNWSNVTNRATINLYNDVSQLTAITVPLKYKNLALYPSLIFDLNRTQYRCTDGDGNENSVQLGVYIQSAQLNLSSTSFNSGAGLVIPYYLDVGNHGGVVVVTGRNGTSGNPFLVQIALMQADNSGGYTPDAVAIISSSGSIPGTLSVSVVSNHCVLATTDATGANNIKASIYGNLLNSSINT